MFKCLVFDFDGTIVNSNKLKKDLFFDVLRSYKIDFNLLSHKISIDGMSRNQIIRDVMYDYDDDIIEKVISDYSKKTLNSISKIKPNLYFNKIIRFALKNNIYLVLSSNTPKKELLKITNNLDITSLFNEIHGFPEIKINTIKKILKKNSFKADQICVLGDGVSDKVSAEVNQTNFFLVVNNDLEKFYKKYCNDK